MSNKANSNEKDASWEITGLFREFSWTEAKTAYKQAEVIKIIVKNRDIRITELERRLADEIAKVESFKEKEANRKIYEDRLAEAAGL